MMVRGEVFGFCIGDGGYGVYIYIIFKYRFFSKESYVGKNKEIQID